MEYEEKLISNIYLLYANNEVKLVRRNISGNDIEITCSNSKGFRDDLKKELLIQLRDSINSDEFSNYRINKLIDNIEEVVNILLVRSAIDMAEKTNLFSNGNNLYINNNDLRAKKIGEVIFKTNLDFPMMKDIDSKIEFIHNTKKSHINNRTLKNNSYSDTFFKELCDIDLMYCARGELGDQFDSCYFVKLSSDVIDDYEVKKCNSRMFSKKRKRIFRYDGIFGKKNA